MSKVSTLTSPFPSAARVASLAAAACMVVAGASAQQASIRTDNTAGPVQSAPVSQFVASNAGDPLNLSSPSLSSSSSPSLDLAHAAGVTYSSSASPALDAVDVDAAANLDLPALPEDASQPPPRRRYGRPRYNDSNHNADGSNKYAFIAGVGLTLATGNTYHYLNTSYSYQVGAGRNFNKNFSVIAQFDWDNFGFNGRTLGNESELLFGDTEADTGLDGSSHVWSFSLNPVYNIYTREGLGAYVVGGVGFYHKVATFTVPEVEIGFGPFGEPEEFEANEIVTHTTSNAVGFNGGFGITYKPSRFSSQRLYAEARYVFVDNPQRQGFTLANQSTTTYAGTDFYPANSNRTTYVPIKVGIRF